MTGWFARLLVLPLSALLFPATGYAQDATPVKGGTLVMARDAEPLTLNPIGASDNGSIFMIVQIFDTLVETRDAPVPQPAIAKSWTVSDDSKTWTFALRENVKFSNGDPLTCEDVKFSIDRFADPKVNTSYGGFGAAIELDRMYRSVDFRHPPQERTGRVPRLSIDLHSLDHTQGRV